jgi:hypothetical protein
MFCIYMYYTHFVRNGFRKFLAGLLCTCTLHLRCSKTDRYFRVPNPESDQIKGFPITVDMLNIKNTSGPDISQKFESGIQYEQFLKSCHFFSHEKN